MNNNSINSLLVKRFGLRRVESLKNMIKSPFVSLILIIIFVLGSQYITLEVNIAKLGQAIKESPFLRLVDFIGGGSCSNSSIFTISVLFIIMSRLLMYIIPFYRNMLLQSNKGRSYERHRFDTFYFDLIVALVFTIILVIYFAKKGIVSTDNGNLIKTLLFYLSGAFILLCIVKIIDKSNDGLLMVMVTGFVISIIHWFIDILSEDIQGFTLWIWLSIVTIFPLAIWTATLLERFNIKIPEILNSKASKVYYFKIYPISPFGKMWFGHTLYLFLTAYIFDLLYVFSCEYENVFLKILIGVIAPFFVTMVIYAQTKIRYNFICNYEAKFLQQKGGFVSGIRPGEATVNYLLEKTKRPFMYELAFLIYGLLIVQVANLIVFPVYLHPLAFVSMWAFVKFIILWKDTIYKFKHKLLY